MIKKVLIGLLISVGLSTQAQTPESVTVEWTYPPSELQGTTFYVSSSTNIAVPLTNWVVLASVANTNKVAIQMLPELRYFAIRGSNSFWGLGNFSSVTNTPSPARSDALLSVRRGAN